MGYVMMAVRNVILSDNKQLVHLAFRDVRLRGMVTVPCQASRGFVRTTKQMYGRYATYTHRSVTCVFCLVH